MTIQIDLWPGIFVSLVYFVLAKWVKRRSEFWWMVFALNTCIGLLYAVSWFMWPY